MMPSDDSGHRRAGVLDVSKDRQDRLHRLRVRDQPDRHLRADPECPLGTDKDAQEVVAGEIRGPSAQPHHLSVREDDGGSQDVIRRDPVLETVRAAGILRHIAADGAGLLAGGIRRVE
jgi:hypothetical protein